MIDVNGNTVNKGDLINLRSVYFSGIARVLNIEQDGRVKLEVQEQTWDRVLGEVFLVPDCDVIRRLGELVR